MAWLAIGILIQIVACAVVGVRLLWLARRTRKLPELCFGGCFVGLGVFGFPVSIAARNGVAGPEVSTWMLGAGLSVQDLACLALVIAVWRVFRPAEAWARGFVVALAVAFVASVVGQGLTVGFADGVDSGFWYWVGLLGRGACFTWSGIEAARYARMLRRRMRLGMASPEVVDRIRLWGHVSFTLAAMTGVFVVTKAMGIDAASSPGVLGLSSLVGVVCSVLLWLTFFPPQAYLRRVVARAAS